MLDSLELNNRLNNLNLHRGGTPAARKQYEATVDSYLREWQRYLADTYAAEFTPTQQAGIFEAASGASDEGDSYLGIEQQYAKYADFARKMLVTA